MALYGIIAFVIYGWVEFEAMAHIVDAIGGLLAFLGIFATAIFGIHLLRTQSQIVMASFRADLAKGQMNNTAIASSLSLLMGAVLMLIPGYVTDALGLLCFMPGLRPIIGAVIAKRFAGKMKAGFANRPFGGAPFAGAHTAETQNSVSPPKDIAGEEIPGEEIIEGEFKEKN